MLVFIFLGVMLGIYGALFCKFNILWSKTFRELDLIKRFPVAEVVLVALTTATIAWYNPYTKISGTRLVEDLLSECTPEQGYDGLCPDGVAGIPRLMRLIVVAIVVKALLYPNPHNGMH